MEIKRQENKWWVFDKDGEGLCCGETIGEAVKCSEKFFCQHTGEKLSLCKCGKCEIQESRKIIKPKSLKNIINLYVSGGVENSHFIEFYGSNEYEIKLTWADGMIGVLPVFDSKENAEKYAGDFDIWHIKRKE